MKFSISNKIAEGDEDTILEISDKMYMSNILETSINNPVKIDKTIDSITKIVDKRKLNNDIINECKEVLRNMDDGEVLVFSKNPEEETGHIVPIDKLDRFTKGLMGESICFQIEKIAM